MAKEDLFAITKAQKPTYLALLRWWETQGNGSEPPPRITELLVPFVTLQRPDGWRLGKCRRMIADKARPYVWDLSLIGYPEIAGLSTFRLRWVNREGEVRDSQPIPTDATAAQVAQLLPAGIGDPEIHGGLVRESETTPELTDGARSPTFNLGRWWLCFANYPEWTPFFLDMSSQRLVGRAQRTHLRPSETGREFFLLSGTDGPTPIHPGALAFAAYSGGKLLVFAHEPRIWQGSVTPVEQTRFQWAVSPFRTEILEGETGEVTITVEAGGSATQTEPVATSVDVTWSAGTTSPDDFSQTFEDWMQAALAGAAGWEWDGARLTATVDPGEVRKQIVIRIPTLDDATTEGDEIASIGINNPLADIGGASISVDTTEVVLIDRNVLDWRITGPATADDGTTETYTLAMSGIPEEGVFAEITISRTGTVSPALFSDWEDALITAVAGRDEFEYDKATSRMLFTAQETAAVGAIQFDVTFLDTASGTFILTLSSPAGSSGVHVETTQPQVVTTITDTGEEPPPTGGPSPTVGGGGGPEEA